MNKDIQTLQKQHTSVPQLSTEQSETKAYCIFLYPEGLLTYCAIGCTVLGGDGFLAFWINGLHSKDLNLQ